MASKLSHEPVEQLAALADTVRALSCNKHARAHFDGLAEQLDAVVPALARHIDEATTAAAFGDTPKQGLVKALQEFAAAAAAITVALGGNPAAPGSRGSVLSSTGGSTASGSSGSASGGTVLSSSSGGSLSGANVRPSANGRRPVLPSGMSTLNPDAFYHAKESVVIALTQLHAAFRGSHPALAKALAAAKLNIEDAGLFEAC